MSGHTPQAPAVVLEVRGEQDAAAASLPSWLRKDDALRGRVRRIEQPAPTGDMGGWSDIVLVALGPGGVAVALASAVTYWLRSRSSALTITARRSDGTELEMSAERVRQLDAAEMTSILGDMARWLDGSPEAPGTFKAIEAHPGRTEEHGAD